MKKCFRKAFLFAVILFYIFPAFAQSQNGKSPIIPGKHRGAVTALVRDGNGRILSTGEDGFLEIWNNQAAVDRFQLSPYAIKAMVLRPGKPQITVVESDGIGLYRISAWDYEAKKNLFTLRFRDPISYINYSASGGFLIVARSGRTGLAFIHPETGEVLESPDNLPGAIAFAATGRSEKNMICYLSSGSLSYWDLEAGTELQRFDAPPNIQSPVLFGNNRFLGGFDSQGLILLDVVTGLVLARDNLISGGTIFVDNSDSSGSGGAVQFNCGSPAGGGYLIYRMEIDLSGRLVTVSQKTVQTDGDVSACISVGADNVVLGATSGTLWLSDKSGIRTLNTGVTGRIIAAAASSSALAFISEGGRIGYLPLDYSLLEDNSILTLEDISDGAALTSITSLPQANTGGAAVPQGTAVSQFLLWQSEEGRSTPVIKSLWGPPVECFTSQSFLDFPLRVPLRSVAVMGASILFLDVSGTVSILNQESGETKYSYSAAGSVDAAFVDPNTIILGSSAVSGTTPFITINTVTGETVPITYPAMVGVRVYRGGSGALYGAAINQSGDNTQTSIIRLNTSNPARSEKLVDFNGEDSSFSMAESGGNLAATLGGGDAVLYRSSPEGKSGGPNLVPLERSIGLPVKIIDGGRWFIVLDGEGCVTWHDNQTGSLLAVFRLYTEKSRQTENLRTSGPEPAFPNLWVLENGGNTIQGKVVKR